MFDRKYFCLYYIILDVKYMNELGFKCIFIDIIFIKYYIIQTKIFMVKVKIKKKSKSQTITFKLRWRSSILGGDIN